MTMCQDHEEKVWPNVVSRGYRSGKRLEWRNGFKLNEVKGKAVMLTAPPKPLLLFWHICRTLASAQPAIGVPEPALMLINIQGVCSLRASHSGAKELMKHTPSSSSWLDGDQDGLAV